jgi:hypothetical protein
MFAEDRNMFEAVMPALVAGIHVFLAGLSTRKAQMAGTSPATTSNKMVQTSAWGLTPKVH